MSTETADYLNAVACPSCARLTADAKLYASHVERLIAELERLLDAAIAEANEWRCADRDKAATIAALEIVCDERDDALDLLRELSSFTVDMPDAWWARVDALLSQKERP